MKKTIVTAFLTGLIVWAYAKPQINGVAFPNSAKIFDLYEITFQLGSYSNPYDSDVIDVYAVFESPDGSSFKVNGFYYEGYRFEEYDGYEKAYAETKNKGWRVRFTPNLAGQWHFTLHAIDKSGKVSINSYASSAFEFKCESVDTAQGFIRQANKRYLKREVVERGQIKSQAFIPVGPNIAWYGNKDSKSYPKGIYDYERYIDSIAGSANYMRIWLTRYQYLSLYGPEYTQMVDKKPTVYFRDINQKDAAELDHIVEYAAQNGVCLMPCIFTFGDFSEKNSSSSRWANNPFNTVLGLKSSTAFFTDTEAKSITKNLIRYIVARWGYATNIVCWEFWNEVNNIPSSDLPEERFHRNIVDWHGEMAQYTRSVDPFGHLLTTSPGTFAEDSYLCRHLFEPLDIVQWHTYGNIQKAKPKEERPRQLFEKSAVVHGLYPDKPIFTGEFGFGQSSGNPKYQDKDPHGIDTHNCLWASLFSTTMGPASFWFWDYLRDNDLLRIYEPMYRFIQDMPLPSETFTAYSTAQISKKSISFPNGIATYYMANAAEDTLYGWSQDTAFSYQALRRLTDKVGKNGHFVDGSVFDPQGYVYTLNANKKPRPGSRSNAIALAIDEQPNGTAYTVRWYDAETGLEMASEATTAVVKNKVLAIEFPSSVRDLAGRRINNTYGDAVFVVTRQDAAKNGGTTQGNATNTKTKAIRPIRKRQ